MRREHASLLVAALSDQGNGDVEDTLLLANRLPRLVHALAGTAHDIQISDTGCSILSGLFEVGENFRRNCVDCRSCCHITIVRLQAVLSIGSSGPEHLAASV